MIGPTAVPALRDAVANGTPRARSAAIDGLAETGHPAASTAPLLNQITQTNDPSTWQALRALAEIQTNTASLLAVLLKHLQNPSPPTPQDFGAAPGVAYALARIGSAGVPALLESLASTQAVVRASAIAAFDPAFQEMLSGKKPSDFYARSGHFQSAFIREMTSEATAKTIGHYPDAYYQKLLGIASQYTLSTDPAIRSAASKVVNYVSTATAQ
jgi:HEAT repeat protein